MQSAGQPATGPDDWLANEREIRSQLARVLASEAFDASGRNRNFLQFVVEETVAGRAAYIKGYTVARSVFGRGADFDPQLDPVVRIEASRLRRSLERYYLTSGKADPIRIDLPKGGYVPRFEYLARGAVSVAAGERHAADDLLPPARAIGDAGPSIVVLPFENLGGELNGDLLAPGITEELIGRLMAYKELRVISANTSFKLAADADPQRIGHRLALGYVLRGTIRIAGSRLRISVQLLDVEGAEYLWTEQFDRELTSNDVWAVQEEVAEEIATRLGAPYGAVARLSQQRLRRRHEQSIDDYLAILKAYGYRRHLTPINHAEVRSCLEGAVEENPASSEVWALLVTVYIDEYRFGLNLRPEPLDRALAAAEQAVKWGGDSALCHLALALVQHYRRDHQSAYATTRRALTLNPDNPEVLAQAASRFVLSGAWDEGLALLRRAMQRDPDPPPWNYILLALDGLRRRDYETALSFSEAAMALGPPHVLVLRCAIYGALGLKESAAAALDEACAKGRNLTELWEQICRSVHDDAVLAEFRGGLTGAGFPP